MEAKTHHHQQQQQHHLHHHQQQQHLQQQHHHQVQHQQHPQLQQHPQHPQHPQQQQHLQQQPPHHQASLEDHDKTYANATNDAAAAVAIVGGSGLGDPNMAGQQQQQQPRQHHHPHHDPNLHPALGMHHDTSMATESPPESLQSPSADGDAGDDSANKTALDTPSKERNSLTLDQRRALRQWANSQSPRPSHKACIEWFLGHYGVNISQSTVSHSLSPKYQRLDSASGDGASQLSGSRLRYGNWPDIERMVLSWYQQVQATGRNPTNEELGAKAKTIFMALPRYRDEKAPEFSPGWIHRFKKRYGLLVRRHRRNTADANANANAATAAAAGPAGGIQNLNEDVNYLAENVPRFMAISAETSAPAIKDSIFRMLGLDSSLHTCILVRDEVVRRAAAGQDPSAGPLDPSGGDPMYVDDSAHSAPDQVTNPDLMLHEQLRFIQQEHDVAEANAAAVRQEGDRTGQQHPQQQRRQQQQQQQHGAGAQPPAGHALGTPTPTRTANNGGMQFANLGPASLSLTPMHSGSPVAAEDKAIRCPFCINQRMLRSVKEAVDHMSTHVVM